MAKKLTSVLGVDIGSQQIKIAEIKLQGREPSITALGIAATPEGTVDHTGVYDVESVGQVLKDLAAESGATVGAAVVSIAGQASVLVRTLEVPKMAPNELKEHMQWEISRNIPFAESTVVSDFKAFEPTDPNAQNMDVVMAISPQSAIDTMIGVLKKAGKQPAAIDVEPLGIARSIVTSYSGEHGNKTVCIVDIGHKTTSINMYKEGQLLMPRQVPLGGENFTSAIADNLNVSADEAEQIKRSTGQIPMDAGSGQAQSANPFGGGAETQAFAPYNPFADEPAPAAEPAPEADPMDVVKPPSAADLEGMIPFSASAPREDEPPAAFETAPGAPVVEEAPYTPAPAPAPTPVSSDDSIRTYNAFAGVLDEFVSEVRRSVDYFRSKGGDVDVIQLCGGGAKLKGLPEFLGKMLGIQCTLFDPLHGIPISAKKLEPGLMENHREEFAIAVGNGLHICFD